MQIIFQHQEIFQLLHFNFKFGLCNIVHFLNVFKKVISCFVSSNFSNCDVNADQSSLQHLRQICHFVPLAFSNLGLVLWSFCIVRVWNKKHL